MDIVRKLTFAHLKASLGNLKPKQKFYLIIFLLSLTVNLIPHEAAAFTIKAPTANKPILVFDFQDQAYQNVFDAIKYGYTTKHVDEVARAEAVKHGKLVVKVKSYLSSQRSPLADYADVLLSVKNWKQIVALANAESTLCRNYIQSTANCWGVGGAKLWDFGNNLGDGILGMSNFLNQYPLRSNVKYSQMTFKQMNGLYKQPAAAHWLYNAQSIYDDLSALEKSI